MLRSSTSSEKMRREKLLCWGKQGRVLGLRFDFDCLVRGSVNHRYLAAEPASNVDLVDCRIDCDREGPISGRYGRNDGVVVPIDHGDALLVGIRYIDAICFRIYRKGLGPPAYGYGRHNL